MKSVSKVMRSLNLALFLLLLTKCSGHQKNQFFRMTLPYMRENENMIFARDYDSEAQSIPRLLRGDHQAGSLLQQDREPNRDRPPVLQGQISVQDTAQHKPKPSDSIFQNETVQSVARPPSRLCLDFPSESQDREGKSKKERQQRVKPTIDKINKHSFGRVKSQVHVRQSSSRGGSNEPPLRARVAKSAGPHGPAHVQRP